MLKQKIRNLQTPWFCKSSVLQLGKKEDVQNCQKKKKKKAEIKARSISCDLRGAELSTEVEQLPGSEAEKLARGGVNKGDRQAESKYILT